MKPMFLLIALFLFCNCNSQAQQCKSYMDVINSIKEEWNAIDGVKDYCGPEVKNDQLICKGAPHASEVCNDTLVLFVYKGGILIEKGSMETIYWLTNNFPQTLNGLQPGMNRESIKKVLGVPLFDEACKLQFKTGKEDDIVLFLHNDSLKTIYHRESSCSD
jgi:hypothetical protein